MWAVNDCDARSGADTFSFTIFSSHREILLAIWCKRSKQRRTRYRSWRSDLVEQGNVVLTVCSNQRELLRQVQLSTLHTERNNVHDFVSFRVLLLLFHFWDVRLKLQLKCISCNDRWGPLVLAKLIPHSVLFAFLFGVFFFLLVDWSCAKKQSLVVKKYNRSTKQQKP